MPRKDDSNICPTLSYFAKRPVEEMPDRLLAHLRVRQDDILHLIVALKKIDGAFEEGLRERRVHHIGRVVAQHLGHVLVEDVPVHLLKPNEVVP